MIQTAADESARMNRELEAAYLHAWPALSQELAARPTHSWPHLVSVAPDYLSAHRRVVVVGQQPYEWAFEDGRREELPGAPTEVIRQLMARYDDFSLSSSRPGSPFWRAVHQIARKAAPGNDPSRSLVWTNVYKVDERNKPPAEAFRRLLINLGLLREEVRILAPQVVVLFTGPNYDWAIDQSLGIRFDPGSREIDVQSRDGITYVRTYHPHYLSRSGKGAVIDHVEEIVLKAAVNPKAGFFSTPPAAPPS